MVANSNREKSNQSMAVSNRGSKRGLSPAPRRGSMDPVPLGDVSAASIAGTVAAQEKQEPYKKSVLKALRSHYPPTTHFGAPICKYGGFSVKINVYNDAGDVRRAEDAIKKQFPHANVVHGEGRGVYEWFFAYVDPVEGVPWGTLVCDTLLALLALGVALAILHSKEWI